MNSRKIAVDVLTQILSKGSYSNIALGKALNDSNICEKDKGLVTEIVYGTIKYKYTIDMVLKEFLKNPVNKMDVFIVNLLRISIYQMKYLDKVPDYAVVNEAVNLSKTISVGASKLVNGVLRNYIRNMNIELKSTNKIEAMSIEYSFEPWMVKLFVNQLGQEKAKLVLEGLNSTPDVTVRVNNLKTTYDEAFESLQNNGYNIQKGFLSKDAIKIIKGQNIENNELFKLGQIIVQDESAMLVAPLMELEDGMTILDLCSAPGGKTTHIAQILNNTGKVRAFDVHEGKLELVKANAERLGITNVECGVMDASVCDETLIDSADRVLIDVPCSGLGIIRKKPEIKWTKSYKDIQSIVEIEKKIIENAAKYVKKGGLLIYSTCTIDRFENEEVVTSFLKNNPDYELEQINIGEKENLIYYRGMLTILPNESMDGFFIAKIKRLR